MRYRICERLNEGHVHVYAETPGYPEAVVVAHALAHRLGGTFLLRSGSAMERTDFEGDAAAWDAHVADLRALVG